MKLKQVKESEYVDPLIRVLEWDDKVYRKGDPIGIKGMKGRLKFWGWYEAPKGPTVLIWHEGRNFRWFYANRIKTKIAKQRRVGKVKVCNDHPTYGAVRRPRSGCETCWNAFRAKYGTVGDNPKPKVKKMKLIPVNIELEEE